MVDVIPMTQGELFQSVCPTCGRNIGDKCWKCDGVRTVYRMPGEDRKRYYRLKHIERKAAWPRRRFYGRRKHGTEDTTEIQQG
jgi:hypothetical protein